MLATTNLVPRRHLKKRQTAFSRVLCHVSTDVEYRIARAADTASHTLERRTHVCTYPDKYLSIFSDQANKMVQTQPEASSASMDKNRNGDQEQPLSSNPPPYSPTTTQNKPVGGTLTLTMLKDQMAKAYSPRPITKLWQSKIPKRPETVPWHVEMAVTMLDILSLMEKGFFWSRGNIKLGENHFLTDSTQFGDFPSALGWTHARRYKLADKEHDIPQWTATMTVYAHSNQVLHGFNPGQLTVHNVLFGAVQNDSLQTVYQFDRQCSDNNFSAFYDATPLAGWWPWPKEK